jgi:hypothetical protein
MINQLFFPPNMVILGLFSKYNSFGYVIAPFFWVTKWQKFTIKKTPVTTIRLNKSSTYQRLKNKTKVLSTGKNPP